MTRRKAERIVRCPFCYRAIVQPKLRRVDCECGAIGRKEAGAGQRGWVFTRQDQPDAIAVRETKN